MRQVIKILICAIIFILTAGVGCQIVANSSLDEFIVVIDAGHGGKDYGAIGAITNEKSINLAVAKKFGEKIKSISKNIKVVYTRDKDVFIPLSDRAKIANKAKGDLFVSIHVNSVSKKNKNRKKIAGSEVYTVGLHKSEDNLAVAQRENSVMTLEADYTETYSGFDPNSIESYIAFELNQSIHIDRSIQFAAEVENQLISTAGRADKGVKQAGFWVLWATSMPSVLVELDFICNPNSEKFMASADGQEKLSTALFNAFVNYYNSVTSDSLVDSVDWRKTTVEEVGDNKNNNEKNNADTIAVTDSIPTIEAELTTNANENKSDNGTNIDDVFIPQPGELEYRIQIIASTKQLSLSSPEFKGESRVEEYIDQGLYKYTCGHYRTEDEANNKLHEYKSQFKGAFVIKMKDGRRIYD